MYPANAAEVCPNNTAPILFFSCSSTGNHPRSSCESVYVGCSCAFHGFPVVLSRTSRRLCGYMHAWQLRSLLQQLLQLEHPLVHAHTLVSFHAFRSSAAAVSAQQHQQHQRERAVRSSVCLLVLDEDGTLRQSFPLLHLAADGRLRVAAPSPAAASAASAQLERGHSEGNKSFSEGSSGAVEMQRLTCVSHPKELATTATETDAGEDAAVAAATGQCTAAGVQVYVDLSLLVDEEVLQLPPHTPLLQVYRLFGLLQCEWVTRIAAVTLPLLLLLLVLLQLRPVQTVLNMPCWDCDRCCFCCRGCSRLLFSMIVCPLLLLRFLKGLFAVSLRCLGGPHRQEEFPHYHEDSTTR